MVLIKSICKGDIMTCFGPPTWQTMHYIAFMSPEEYTEEFIYWSKVYIYSMVHLIPCPNCRYHFSTLLQNMPLQNQTKLAFCHWTVDAHNEVNKRLNKPIISYDEAKELYSTSVSGCAEPNLQKYTELFIPPHNELPSYSSVKNSSFSKKPSLWGIVFLILLFVLVFSLGYIILNRKKQ